MEGGDAWVNAPETDVYNMFHIQGTDDGLGDLSTIVGEESNFLNGFTFTYGGINNYIDHIEPAEGAQLLMSNQDPYYGVMVSYENDTYKTIGSSCQFAGFVDEGGNKKDGVMAEILSFFDVGYTWTGVREQKEQTSDVTAYPNPFSHNITIDFNLNSTSDVTLDIYDLTGRKISTLIKGNLNAGRHQFVWNAQNRNGQRVPTGVYFFNLHNGNIITTRKIILTR